MILVFSYIFYMTYKRTTPDAKPTHRRRERETDRREGETERDPTARGPSNSSSRVNERSKGTITHAARHSKGTIYSAETAETNVRSVDESTFQSLRHALILLQDIAR